MRYKQWKFIKAALSYGFWRRKQVAPILILVGVLALLAIIFYIYLNPNGQANRQNPDSPRAHTGSLRSGTIAYAPPAVRSPSSQPVLLQEEQITVQPEVQRFYSFAYTEQIETPSWKRIEGAVTWNEESGSDGTPVVGMPVFICKADHGAKELTVLVTERTDTAGEFIAYVDPNIKPVFLGDITYAQNIPDNVRQATAAP